MNEEENDKDKIVHDTNYFFILLFSSIFIIIYVIYLIPILKYIFKNCLRNKICVYWIDYTILIFSGIMFIIIYIINLAKFDIEKGGKRINTINELSSNIYSTLIIVFLTIMCVTIINSLFLDSIIACKLSNIMNKIKKIQEQNFFELSEKLKGANVVNILKFRFTFFYNIVFFIIDIVYIVLVTIAYKDTEITRFKGYINLRSFTGYLLRYYHVVILALLLISIIIMNFHKKSLLKIHYYNPNRLAQKIYDVYFNTIIYFTDIISFKLVSDLVMNIPTLLFLSKKKFDTASLIISELAIFIYMFLGGSEYLIIDKNSKAAKLSYLIKKLFCLDYLDFHFGQKDHNFILDQFKYNYSNEEQNILNNLNMTIVTNIEKNMLDIEEKDNFNINGELELDESSENIFVEKPKKLEFKTVSEFYLIQKLMMMYFKENKKIYESNTENNNNENSFSFSFHNSLKKHKKSNKSMNNQEKNNYKSNIEKINRMSILDSKKLKPSLKYKNNDLISSIEEKELYEELKCIYNPKEKNKNNNYKIENLFSSELFELFPFFQMNINSIINSLEPTKNIKVFNKFVNRNKNKIKERISRFCVKSDYYKNNFINAEKEENEEKEEIDKQKDIENNLYYTNDLYLMYEIFEVEEFINYDEVKNIVIEYNKYLLSVIKNMNYSFLPLILGIFNIEILNCRNIIILYRNPLYFTNFNNFNRWVSFYLTEESEKMKVSTLFNDIIDINEIELNNKLELNDNDYDEIRQVLNNDFTFIKNINGIFPIIHLFIGEESNINENDKIKKNIENTLIGDSFSNKNIIDILDKNLSMSLSENIINVNNENSLFEKEYYTMSGNSIKTIKIYFTNFFRENKKINKYKISNYYGNMLDKIVKYLSKNKLFNEDDKEE